MTLNLSWNQIAFRLVCAILAGLILGLDRSEHGRAAGLRTSMLVCVAACIAMIQVNLLLPMAGKSPDSFITNDLMRLPLGILSGIGFIGAGAIVRRDNFVRGVTTAATIWILTVLGLCFGGGQVPLGLIGTVIAATILTLLSFIERKMKHDRSGRLVLVVAGSGPGEGEIGSEILRDGFRLSSCGYTAEENLGRREWTCEVQWRATQSDTKLPSFIARLESEQGVVRVSWTPQGR
jgi:putative Mg2+ transporter-C (MgtC) family protein